MVDRLIFSCDQAALWMVQSVPPSVRPSLPQFVRPSVCHTFFSYVHIIVSSWNFQELLPLTKVMSMQKVEVKGQGHRGQTQFSSLWSVTPVWIHIWRWNDAQSLMWFKKGALLFYQGHLSNFKVTRQKFADFHANWAFTDCYPTNSSLNSQMAAKWYTKLDVA